MLRFVQERGADVGSRRGTWLWSATSPAQRGAWSETLKALAAIDGSPLREIDPEERRRLTGSDPHFGGVVDDACATVQPALLVREMRRAALEAGVTLYERTHLQERQRLTEGHHARRSDQSHDDTARMA